MSKQFFRFNYRRNLLLMLIFLQLLTVTSIILLSRINIDRLIVDQAYDAMAKTIVQSVNHTRLFVEPSYRTSTTIKTLMDNDVINFKNVETVEKLFFNELLNNPNFAGIYIANDNGDFIYMGRTQQNQSSAKRQEHAFITKIISQSSNERKVTLRWRKDTFDQTRQVSDPTDEYNAKNRPWYILATEFQRASWTDPYTFFTSKRTGVTIAVPFKNAKTQNTGVIGVDIEIHQLSNFLDSINNNDHYIRIMDGKNNLIAETSNMNALSEQYVQNLLEENKVSTKLRNTFNQNGEEYLFVQEKLASLHAEIPFPQWNILTYAKTSPFLVKTRAIEKRNIYIAVITLFLSILLSILIASKTSKPVENWMNQATTDSLTGLYSRHFFFNTGNTIFNDHIKNQNHHLSLMMIDVDLFKQVNDNYGHSIGDEVLKALSNCLRSVAGDDELLARFGGEEFILLTNVKSANEAMHLAENIRQTVEELRIKTAVGELSITVSIGVALTKPKLNMSFMEFIGYADYTLYESKDSGRNQVTLANTSTPINHKV